MNTLNPLRTGREHAPKILRPASVHEARVRQHRWQAQDFMNIRSDWAYGSLQK